MQIMKFCDHKGALNAFWYNHNIKMLHKTSEKGAQHELQVSRVSWMRDEKKNKISITIFVAFLSHSFGTD